MLSCLCQRCNKLPLEQLWNSLVSYLPWQKDSTLQQPLSVHYKAGFMALQRCQVSSFSPALQGRGNELLQASSEEWFLISSTCKRGQQGRRGMKCKALQAAAPVSPWRALCSGIGWFHRDHGFKHRSNWIADVFSDGYLLAKLQLKQEQKQNREVLGNKTNGRKSGHL